jgi:hypothetical protein
MKNNLFKIGLLIALTITMSCQKEKKSISELILGRWEWASSVNSWFPDQFETPRTAGYSKAFEFYDNGTAKEYLNDQFVNSYDYSLSEGSTDRFILTTGNNLNYTSFTLQSDKLIFNYSAYDGPVMTYIRKN